MKSTHWRMECTLPGCLAVWLFGCLAVWHHRSRLQTMAVHPAGLLVRPVSGRAGKIHCAAPGEKQIAKSNAIRCKYNSCYRLRFFDESNAPSLPLYPEFRLNSETDNAVRKQTILHFVNLLFLVVRIISRSHTPAWECISCLPNTAAWVPTQERGNQENIYSSSS